MVPLNNWVICQQRKNSASFRLFCFPYAGGGASVYRTWNKESTSDVEICWIQWPGRENRIREQPFETIDELVPALVDGLAEWLVPPFAFYGHSLGAKIAFETSRQLRRIGGAQPCHLFVGASQAPQLSWPHQTLHVLREDDFIQEIQKRYGGVPREILQDPELRALLIPTLRADVRMMETYRYDPEPPLNCDITVFGGSNDPTVDRSALDAWRHQTCQAFQLLMVPGDHFFLHSARQQLLGAIGRSLN